MSVKQTYVLKGYDPKRHTWVKTVSSHASDRDARNALADKGLIPYEVRQYHSATIQPSSRYAEQKASLLEACAGALRRGVQPHTMRHDVMERFAGDRFLPHAKAFLDDNKANHDVWECMEAQPRVWSPSEVRVARIGKDNSAEADTLVLLAQALRRNSKMFKRLRDKLVYPALLTIMLVIALSVYLRSFVPSLMSIFTDVSEPPPQTLVIAAAVSNWLTGWHLAVVGIALVVAYAAWLAIRRVPNIDRFIDRTTMRMIIFGEIVHKARLAEIIFVLRLMCTAGRQYEAYGAAAATARGRVLREALEHAQKTIEQKRIVQLHAGEAALSGWSRALFLTTHVIPRQIVGDIALAEHNSALEAAFARIYDELEQRVIDLAEVLPQRIEHASLVVYACVVAGMVFLMVLPAFHAIVNFH